MAPAKKKSKSKGRSKKPKAMNYHSLKSFLFKEYGSQFKRGYNDPNFNKAVSDVYQNQKDNPKSEKGLKISFGRAKSKYLKKPKKAKPKTHYQKIKNWLWGKYGKDYKGKNDPKFILIARSVADECDILKCRKADVFQIYQAILKETPDISPELYEDAFPYFELSGVEFNYFPKYLTIVSDLLPRGEVSVKEYVKGGSESYDKYFKRWVDWANQAHDNVFGTPRSSDKVMIFFTFGVPFFNGTKNRWEVELYSCQADRTPDDFGYERENPDPDVLEVPDKRKRTKREQRKLEGLMELKRKEKIAKLKSEIYQAKLIKTDRDFLIKELKKIIKPLVEENKKIESVLNNPRTSKTVQKLYEKKLITLSKKLQPLELLIINLYSATSFQDPNIVKAAKIVGYAPLVDTFIPKVTVEKYERLNKERKAKALQFKKELKETLKKVKSMDVPKKAVKKKTTKKVVKKAVPKKKVSNRKTTNNRKKK